MTFATDVTAIYAGRGGGKTVLSRKMIKDAKLPRVVFIDPVGRGGFTSARDVMDALDSGAKIVTLTVANRDECLRTIYATYMRSTAAAPVYIVCDEAPAYLDKPTDALRKIMYQGRHRGLGMMILAQRPTAVAAALRSQAAQTYWGRITEHNDIQIAAQAIGPARARTLSTARPGQFIRHPE